VLCISNAPVISRIAELFPQPVLDQQVVLVAHLAVAQETMEVLVSYPLAVEVLLVVSALWAMAVMPQF
jgi:hypothetical protein